MASLSKSELCSICVEQSLTEKASTWCPECDDYLCCNCNKHHSVSKATRKHKTVDIASISVLPEFLFDIKTTCDIHGEALEYFCPTHDCSFCVNCTSNHRNCGEFTVLRNMDGVKTTQTIGKLEDLIAALQSTLIKILESQKNNKRDLTDNYHAILKQIKDIRENINRHLDNLEKKVLDELEIEYKLHNTTISKLIENVQLHTSKLDKIKVDLDQIKKHASDIQMFFGMRKIQKEMKDEDKKVDIIAKSSNIEEIKTSFKPNSSWLDANISESLGSIHVHKNKVEVTYPQPVANDAQSLIPAPNISTIDSIRVNKIAEIDLSESVPNAKIEGCCFTADDMILLTDDKNNQIIVLDHQGHYLRAIKLEFSPDDITIFDNNIAVSSYFAKAVHKLNVSDGRKICEVTFDTKCDALAIAGKRLIVHLREKNYTICDESLNIIGTIPVHIAFAPFLAYMDEKLFVPQWKEETVYCYNMKGDLIWKCQNENLQMPHGIVTGNDGYIFVAGYNSSNIVALSRVDGSVEREVVTLKNLMAQPMAISCNSSKNKLLITSNGSSTILLCDLDKE